MKILCSIILAVFVMSTVQAQMFSIENWNKYADGGVTSTNLLWSTAPLGENLHFEAFALVSTSGFAESYVGLGTNVSDHLYVSGSAGFVNSSENPLRLSATAIAFVGKLTWVNIVEWGPSSSYWYNSHLKYKVNDTWSLGVLGRRYAGVGPRVDVNMGMMSAWSAVLYDYETQIWSANLGVKATLKAKAK